MCGIVGILSRQRVGTIAPANAMDNLEKPCYDFKGAASIQNRNS